MVQGQSIREHGCYAEQYLYGLRHDPYELINLVQCASHEGVRRVMRERLRRRMAGIGEAPAQIVAAEPTPADQRRVTDSEARE